MSQFNEEGSYAGMFERKASGKIIPLLWKKRREKNQTEYLL